MLTESSVGETPYDWIPLGWNELAIKENALIVAVGKRDIMTVPLNQTGHCLASSHLRLV